MSKIAPIIKAMFKKRVNQDEKLIENIRKLDEKEKAKQQESKIHGQKPVKQSRRSKKTRVYNS